VLTDSGVVRSDITSSLGSGGGVAGGVPLAVELTVVDSGSGCAPFTGAAVYLWHCDREGRYSMYSDGVTDESYLRGVQAAAADGRVRFASIFPGAYTGRWPHIHFEVYETIADATSGGRPIAVSQLALPEAVCAEVYAESGYEASISNLAGTSLESDGIFADGSSQQLAAVTGAVSSGLTASLSVPV
jgi:protocatechuate 3,4-dioxygenase beta subunit